MTASRGERVNAGVFINARAWSPATRAIERSPAFTEKRACPAEACGRRCDPRTCACQPCECGTCAARSCRAAGPADRCALSASEVWERLKAGATYGQIRLVDRERAA